MDIKKVRYEVRQNLYFDNIKDAIDICYITPDIVTSSPDCYIELAPGKVYDLPENYNCRNCGAPVRGYRCEYCGTAY